MQEVQSVRELRRSCQHVLRVRIQLPSMAAWGHCRQYEWNFGINLCHRRIRTPTHGTVSDSKIIVSRKWLLFWKQFFHLQLNGKLFDFVNNLFYLWNKITNGFSLLLRWLLFTALFSAMGSVEFFLILSFLLEFSKFFTFKQCSETKVFTWLTKIWMLNIFFNNNCEIFK